jgi:hypothetical protein
MVVFNIRCRFDFDKSPAFASATMEHIDTNQDALMFERCLVRIRVEAKRAALDAIAGPVFEAGVHQNVHQIGTSDSAASSKSLN